MPYNEHMKFRNIEGSYKNLFTPAVNRYAISNFDKTTHTMTMKLDEKRTNGKVTTKTFSSTSKVMKTKKCDVDEIVPGDCKEVRA